MIIHSIFLAACVAPTSAGIDYVSDFSTFDSPHLINVVVEIPAGTNEKWQVDKNTGGIEWEQENGKPRVVQYLAYPGNYGMIPRTSLPQDKGGDGDPLDVILLGPAVRRGAVVAARPIGVLRLLDDRERDDKILAVQTSGPLSDVTDIDVLESRYPGIQLIIETWFAHYKQGGRLESQGLQNAESAMQIILEANRYFASPD